MEYKYKVNPNGNCWLCTRKNEWGKLIGCYICDRYFHKECLKLKTIPEEFTCPKCETLFGKKEAEIKSIQEEAERLTNENKLLEKKLAEIKEGKNKLLQRVEKIQEEQKNAETRVEQISTEKEQFKKLVDERDAEIKNLTWHLKELIEKDSVAEEIHKDLQLAPLSSTSQHTVNSLIEPLGQTTKEISQPTPIKERKLEILENHEGQKLVALSSTDQHMAKDGHNLNEPSEQATQAISQIATATNVPEKRIETNLDQPRNDSPELERQLTEIKKRIESLSKSRLDESPTTPTAPPQVTIVQPSSEMGILTATLNKMVMAMNISKNSLLVLPNFDGVQKKWPKFRSIFYETAQTAGFTRLENLNRLQKHLRRDALKAVSSLMHDQNNLDNIMDRLEKLYGNPDVIYDALLADLTNAKEPSLETSSTFIDFTNALNNLIRNMTLLNREEYLNDQRLLRDLVSKLPSSLRNNWLIEKSCCATLTLTDLTEWLKPTEELAILLESRDLGSKKSAKMSPIQTANRQQFKDKCLNCNKQHKTTECKTLLANSAEQRWAILRGKGICTNCCRLTNHTSYNCKFPPQCNVYGCREKHHSILHAQTVPKNYDQARRVNYHSSNKQLFYQIVPVTLKNGEVEVNTFAFIDPGSSTSLILEDVKNLLKAEGPNKPLTLSWTNGEVQDENESQSIAIQIRGKQGKTYDVSNVRSVKHLDLPTQSIDAQQLADNYSHLCDVGIDSYTNATPTILLGLPHAYITRGTSPREGEPDEPIAHHTRLGWVLFGGHDKRDRECNLFTMIEKQEEDEKSLRQMMKEYFSTEESGVKVTQNSLIPKKDELALGIMQETLRYSNGQYEIGLLWKDANVVLPNSYEQALRRLKTQERKMEKDSELKGWPRSENI